LKEHGQGRGVNWSIGLSEAVTALAESLSGSVEWIAGLQYLDQMRGLGVVEAAAEAEGFRTVVERYCASSEGLCRNGQIGIREREE
jgi:hypothetical protein